MKTEKFVKSIFKSVVTTVLKSECWISGHEFTFHVLIETSSAFICDEVLPLVMLPGGIGAQLSHL